MTNTKILTFRVSCAALACVVSTLLTPALAQQILCGDCDGNNRIEIVDALKAAQTATGIATIISPDLEACDVQPPGGNGLVSITDALGIAQYVVGLPGILDCNPPPGLFLEDFDHQLLPHEKPS